MISTRKIPVSGVALKQTLRPRQLLPLFRRCLSVRGVIDFETPTKSASDLGAAVCNNVIPAVC